MNDADSLRILERETINRPFQKPQSLIVASFKGLQENLMFKCHSDRDDLTIVLVSGMFIRPGTGTIH